ncbi:MAG: complex I subunit 1 family protein [Candidatus Micrarchaeaceae archaeon]
MLTNNIYLNAFAYAVIAALVVIVFDYIYGWIERKLLGKVQSRHGPNYVGKYGIWQNIADIVKLLAKENIKTRNTHGLILYSSIVLLFSLTLFIVFVLPLIPNLFVFSSQYTLLLIMTIIGFMPLLIFLSGFSTGNKFADISAQRSVLILLAYELPLLIVLLSIIRLAGSASLISIVNMQKGHYFALIMPLGFIVFFIAILAEMERPPFDLREADSELIAGWLTDVGAPYYSIALFLDYTRAFLGSLLIALLFFGGWNGPLFPIPIWLYIKVAIISLLLILIRGMMYRMRIDRILRFGWTVLLPLSLINLVLIYMIA